MSATPTDTSIEIQGYVTDPKFVGYQVLTNYESTYWGALVGNDAWRFYEVLRSFCHQQKSTCFPSINLLLAILGFKEREKIIGRPTPKIVKGKKYYYPGLIQTLQDFNLAAAEVVGAGPKMRYRFHVNRTPGLLTAEQLNTLPKVLQTKHVELLAKCEEAQAEFNAKKRPSKLPNDAFELRPEDGQTRGVGNSDTPLGNADSPSRNFRAKQQPNNSTHQTTTTERSTADVSTPPDLDPSQPDPVVVALQELGCKASHSKKLAKTARQNQIDVLGLIAYGQFKIETNPDSIRDLKRWVITGVQRGYDLTEWVEHKAQEAERAAKRQQRTEQQAAFKQQMAERQTDTATERAERERVQLNKLRRHYKTPENLEQTWAAILNRLKTQMTPATFSLFNGSHLLTEDPNQVVICLANAFIMQKVAESPELQLQLNQALASQFDNRQLNLEFVHLASALTLSD